MWQICCRRGVGVGVLHGSKPASQSLSAALLEDFCLQTNISQEDGSSPPPSNFSCVLSPPPCERLSTVCVGRGVPLLGD